MCETVNKKINKSHALKAHMATTRDRPPKTALLHLPGWVAQTERPHRICEQKRKTCFAQQLQLAHICLQSAAIFFVLRPCCILLHAHTPTHTQAALLTAAVRLLRPVIWAPESKARRPAAGVHAHTLFAHRQGGAGKRDVMRGLILPTWHPLAASCCSSFKRSCL